jgi:hypothetical protein
MAFNRTLAHFTSSQELATEWASGQSYITGQIVIENNALYKALIGHTSGLSFATDLAAGKWVAIESSGGGGEKNYIENPDFNTGSVSGWGLFNTTLTSKIPTGSIIAGAASITTFAADNSVTPLSGAYSLKVASSGALSAGHGFISDAFTIDKEDQAKVMGWSFAYEKIAGTLDFSGTSNNTWAVYIYDVTGAAWIQPAGVYNLVQSSGVDIASGTFQTTATGTQYRIALVCVTATAGATDMRFDSFNLGPSITVQGAAVSDWVSYTPTGTWVANATYTGKYRRVGDSLEVQARVATSGAPSGALTFSIPAGLSIDTAKLNSSVAGFTAIEGQAVINDSSITGYKAFPVYNSATSILIAFQNNVSGAATGANQASPITFGAGDSAEVVFTAPISGWSSNTVLSQDTDTRVVAASVYPAVAQPALVTGTPTKVLFDTINFGDTHAAFDFINDWYRAPVSGWYQISATVAFGTNNVGARAVGYRIDGTFVRWMTSFQSSTGDTTRCVGGALAYLNAGSYVEIFAFQNSGGPLSISVGADNTHFSICRQSGPATIAASETVGCAYNTLPAGTVTGAGIDLIYLTREFDTHGAYSTSTGEYTVPVSGLYTINGAYRTQTTAMTITHGTTLYVRIDNVLVKFIQILRTQTASGILREIMGIPVTLRLNAGQKIKLAASSDTNAAIDTASLPTAFNWISIIRTGN